MKERLPLAEISLDKLNTSHSMKDIKSNTLKNRYPLKTIDENAIASPSKLKTKKFDNAGQSTGVVSKSGARAIATTAVQTDDAEVSLDTSSKEDLIYWKKLASTRQKMLEKALATNESLKERVKFLEEENSLLKDVVQKAEDVMQAVQEWTTD